MTEAEMRAILLAALKELVRFNLQQYGSRDALEIITAKGVIAQAEAYTPP